MSENQVEHIKIKRITSKQSEEVYDMVAVEEPMEIQLAYSTGNGLMKKNISVTMRTPGHDPELAAGFLFTEGIIQSQEAIKEIKHLSFDENRVLVNLHENVIPAISKTDRNFYITSGCGICGKASIDAIRTLPVYMEEKDNLSVPAGIFFRLQDSLRKEQEVFKHTGGIHASAIFDLAGKLIMLREDVGRHNAPGQNNWRSFIKKITSPGSLLTLLSGRASFELIQKAVIGGIKFVAAVGAPSSLAIELAKEAGITLIGFLRDNGFNIYSGDQRIKL